MRRGSLAAALAAAVLAGASLACQTKPPVVNVQAPPCECSCAHEFRATAPQVGKGCYVQDDLLVCPLVRRTLDLEPAYPGEDPRCEGQPDGTIRCEVAD